jgi:hypothetical protein
MSGALDSLGAPGATANAPPDSTSGNAAVAIPQHAKTARRARRCAVSQVFAIVVLRVLCSSSGGGKSACEQERHRAQQLLRDGVGSALEKDVRGPSGLSSHSRRLVMGAVTTAPRYGIGRRLTGDSAQPAQNAMLA